MFGYGSVYEEPMMPHAHLTDAQVMRELKQSRKAANATSRNRAALPPGSSRAKVTTANARCDRACRQAMRWERVAVARGLAIPGWEPGE